MLTARVEDRDKISGLAFGADDYITKPFNPLEVVARVKAQLRRYRKYGAAPKEEERLDIGGLSICRQSHTCTLNGKPLCLTPTEFSILWILCQRRGSIVAAEELFQQVWAKNIWMETTLSWCISAACGKKWASRRVGQRSLKPYGVLAIKSISPP